jgi:nitrile hydratase
VGARRPRFAVGEGVRVRTEVPNGNPRTPEYVRGKRGVIDVVHGTMANPIDHRGVHPTLYTVRFVIKDLFGGAVEDTLRVDVHEEWLEQA